jgi:hypothetical protein
MTTTIDTVIQQPAAKAHRNRGRMALVAGFLVAGALATTAVIVANDDDASAPARPATTQAAPSPDPLVTRFGQPSTLHSDQVALDREMRFAQRP